MKNIPKVIYHMLNLITRIPFSLVLAAPMLEVHSCSASPMGWQQEQQQQDDSFKKEYIIIIIHAYIYIYIKRERERERERVCKPTSVSCCNLCRFGGASSTTTRSFLFFKGSGITFSFSSSTHSPSSMQALTSS